MQSNSVPKILLVVILLCGVCSLIVSTIAVKMRPLQEHNIEKELRKTILEVTDMYQAGQDNTSKLSSVNTRIINLENGKFADFSDADQLDIESVLSDVKMSQPIPAKQDIASIGRLSKYVKIHLINENERLKYIVLPIHGYGLWSTLYGFIALYADGNTIYGLKFYQHKETPGLGGRVDDVVWRTQWRDKKIYDKNGQPSLVIGKCRTMNQLKTEHRIDSLSGATITSCGVNNMIDFWFGEKGYQRFLTNKPFIKEING